MVAAVCTAGLQSSSPGALLLLLLLQGGEEGGSRGSGRGGCACPPLHGETPLPVGQHTPSSSHKETPNEGQDSEHQNVTFLKC